LIKPDNSPTREAAASPLCKIAIMPWCFVAQCKVHTMKKLSLGGGRTVAVSDFSNVPAFCCERANGKRPKAIPGDGGWSTEKTNGISH
jgi:hypothetical protein